MKSASVIVLLVALGFAACGGDKQTTTSPSSSSSTSPTTQTFSSVVYPRGVLTETFVAAKAGTLTVTLTSASFAIALGVGLGIPNPSAPGCTLFTNVNTMPGSSAQITAAADAGTYCVSVYDIGFVPLAGVTFTVSVVHP